MQIMLFKQIRIKRATLKNVALKKTKKYNFKLQ